MDIYVGNLSYDVTDEDLRQAFESFGQVASATVMKDKFGGASFLSKGEVSGGSESGQDHSPALEYDVE